MPIDFVLYRLLSVSGRGLLNEDFRQDDFFQTWKKCISIVPASHLLQQLCSISLERSSAVTMSSSRRDKSYE